MDNCRLTRIFIIAFITALHTSGSLGASFDCGLARSAFEHAICDDSRLSALDDKLSSAYKLIRGSSLDTTAFRESQREWLARARVCPDNDCRIQAYSSRISDLNTITAQLQSEHTIPNESLSSQINAAPSAVDTAVTPGAAIPEDNTSISEQATTPVTSNAPESRPSVSKEPASTMASTVPPPSASKESDEPIFTPKLILELSAAGLLVLIGSAFFFHAHQFDQSGREKRTYWVRFFFMYVFWLATGLFLLVVGILKTLVSAHSSKGGNEGGSATSVSQSSTNTKSSSDDTTATSYCVQKLPKGQAVWQNIAGVLPMHWAVERAVAEKQKHPDFAIRVVEMRGGKPTSTSVYSA